MFELSVDGLGQDLGRFEGLRFGLLAAGLERSIGEESEGTSRQDDANRHKGQQIGSAALAGRSSFCMLPSNMWARLVAATS